MKTKKEISKKDLLCYRSYVEDTDLPFILSTWLEGFYYGSDYFVDSIAKNYYFKHYQILLKQILLKSVIRMCCLKDDKDVLLGYSVSEPKILHWVYVKTDWRKIGIANELLGDFPLKSCTHWTNAAPLMPKLKAMTHNPYLLIFESEELYG